MADPDELARRLAAAGVFGPDPDADAAGTSNLFQVMRAVEDAETTIRQQLEENGRLKEELMRKTRELDRIRSEATNQASPSTAGPLDQDRAVEAYGNSSYSSDAAGNKAESPKSFNNVTVERGDQMNQKYLDASRSDEMPRRLKSGEQAAAETGVTSRLSTTASSCSLSPTRHRREGEYDSRLNLAGQGMEMSTNIIWKQDWKDTDVA